MSGTRQQASTGRGTALGSWEARRPVLKATKKQLTGKQEKGPTTVMRLSAEERYLADEDVEKHRKSYEDSRESGATQKDRVKVRATWSFLVTTGKPRPVSARLVWTQVWPTHCSRKADRRHKQHGDLLGGVSETERIYREGCEKQLRIWESPEVDVCWTCEQHGYWTMCLHPSSGSSQRRASSCASGGVD